MARALMTYSAPSHRIESQLLSAARILEVDADYVHLPGILLCSFGNADSKTSETHFLKCGGRLNLGALHKVHQVYRMVVHDEISAEDANLDLNKILESPLIYGSVMRVILAFMISALICPLAFGGSILDMWIAGLGGVSLALMHLFTASKSQLHASVFEVTVTIVISFVARALSSVPSQLFCYTSISSAAIVSILPGYLVLTSSLELGSKSIVGGSIKMVYALIYTLFIGYGLQIGSDLYLLVDQSAAAKYALFENSFNAIVTVTGRFTPDAVAVVSSMAATQIPIAGSFTFTNSTPYASQDLHMGCYRPESFPWYLQTFPWWTQFLIVPVFAVLSSLANLQPWKTFDMVVMVAIACCGYSTNKIAARFIYENTDIVSFIGAAVVGFLGNLYARLKRGTAFTVMVTGVLFMVPSGLSEAGGITAQGDGNGIAIGGAMIKVSVGITVGLLFSQGLVYVFGKKKNAAMFAF